MNIIIVIIIIIIISFSGYLQVAFPESEFEVEEITNKRERERLDNLFNDKKISTGSFYRFDIEYCTKPLYFIHTLYTLSSVNVRQ